MINNNEIALMFSGGLDTTYLALQLAERFSKVHLLTFCNGFCLRVDASKKHVVMLQEKYGKEKFEHTIFSISEIFSFIKNGLLRDMLAYHSPLVFDLCCKLSMEVATIAYCTKNKVSYVIDGNNPYTQGEIFMQQSEYLGVVQKFFSRHNIQYLLEGRHKESRNEILRKLDSCGINTGIRLFEYIGITPQLFTQPFCLWAPIAFFFTSQLRHFPLIKYFDLPIAKAINLRHRKEKTAEVLIEYFKFNYAASLIYPCKKSILSRFLRQKC
jgi:hypothetical protein